ncbi:MAG: DUF1566 domain-containing protein [Polyangia bacterium]
MLLRNDKEVAIAIVLYMFFLVVAAGCKGVSLREDCSCEEYDCSDAGEGLDTDSNTETEIATQCSGGRMALETQLCWQNPKADGLFDHQGAIAYCDEKDTGNNMFWYLPSREDFMELLGGCDEEVGEGGSGECNSCEESSMCNVLFEDYQGTFWSSTIHGTAAWYADFETGQIGYDYRSSEYMVRCVHLGR